MAGGTGPGPNLQGALDLSALVRRAQQPADATPVRTVDDATFGEIVELSQQVPVVVEFRDDRVPDSGVASIIDGYAGRIAYAAIDAMMSPQLVQAFRVEQLPTFAAVIGGRPVPLFAGVLAEPQLRELLEQLLQVAAQQGVGAAPAEDGSAEPSPAEPPLPPLHQAAYDAIEVADYPTAIAAYEQAIKENPRDALAAAGLAQVRLLHRLDGPEADAADRAIAAGDVAAALGGLLDEFGAADADRREAIRARLLEFFEILGAEDPHVIAARRRLTSLLF